MARGLNLFLGFSFLIILVVVGIQYKRMIVDQDYILYSHVSCDPTFESCFVLNCDITEQDCDNTPYKKIEKKAYNAPNCDLSKPECIDLACEVGEESCSIILCTEDSLEEGEVCLDIEKSTVKEVIETAK